MVQKHHWNLFRSRYHNYFRFIFVTDHMDLPSSYPLFNHSLCEIAICPLPYYALQPLLHAFSFLYDNELSCKVIANDDRFQAVKESS
jgi:hypothetical protein